MSNADLLRRWYENLWTRGIESTIDEMIDDDFVAHGLGPDALRGPEALRAFYRSYRAAFPRIRVELTDVRESGDMVSARARVEVAKSDGAEPYTFEGATFVRMEGGRFVEGWNHFDFLALLMQMKVVPEDSMAIALAPAVPALDLPPAPDLPPVLDLPPVG